MIVRVLTEGQYRVADELRGRLNEIDERLLAAVDAGDEDAFHARYDELLALVRAEGEQLADADLTGSDLMLPPPDVSLAEARGAFAEHRLIPE
jgi:hypothetical protein